ncbi:MULTISPECIES: SusC/RagA family TonB-linked outer membrane protein [Rhodonellum]|nr:MULTISPECIES: TonB-dependent receptor [Rhodonellum]MDO9554477.1 TonB-dependent receptor [Rhodonellum sp.]
MQHQLKSRWNPVFLPLQNKIRSQAFFVLSLIFLGLLPSMSFAQQILVKGQVMSGDDNLPVPGATILLKNSQKGTITDVDGLYTIEVPSTGSILIFSYVGYNTQEVQVNNQNTINVTLQTDTQDLGEVVVVGYGTVKKSDLTGSVVSIRDKDLTAIPVTNALEVMQGKVPGLDLTKASGQPGAGLNFTIRGNRSLNASNGPLIIVDGIIYGPNMDVNPNDIASIEVLKDASATAIYGTLGANGVILVTTKRGASGKSKISVNSYYGVQTLGGYADIMTGPEWVDLRRESRRTVGEWNSPADDEKIFNPTQLENFQNGRYTDWAQQLLGTGSQQNHQISTSGGSDKATYYFSMEYFNEKGLLERDELNRYSGRLTVDYKVLDNLKLTTNLMYTMKDQDRRTDPMNQANKMSPLGMPFDSEGNVNTFPVGDASTLNPLMDQVRGNFEDNELNKRFFGNLSLDWNATKNLTVTSRLGIDAITMRRGLFAATNTIATGANGLSLARADNNSFSRTTWENFATYTYVSGDHEWQGLLGTSIWTESSENYFAEGRNLLSPTMLFNNLGASQTGIRLGSSLEERSLASFFGRVNYKFKNRYLLTLLMRSDGSSVLSKGNKWGYFPSAALSWILKEESFLQNMEGLTDLKIRTSYGISGNSAVNPYQTLGGLSKSTYAFDRGTAESPAFGFYPSLISAPTLSWETTATTNFGLDFGFFNNRITGSIDAYQQDTKDLLMQRALPTTSGFSSSWDNVGKVRNRGIEALISTINVDRMNGIRWNSDITFSSNKESIMELVDGDRDLANGWFVGHPINSFYDYQKIGIWQLGEEDAAAVNQQLPGEVRVRDQDGDGLITPEDRVIIGSAVPKFTLGFNNRVTYKGVELSFFIYARQGQMIVSEAAGSYKIDGLENGPKLDYWTPENPTNDYPRPNAGTSRASTRYYSTLQYVDGSFVKIRDVTVGYNFPTAVTERLKVSRLRFYATAKNYFVFSNMGPYDPERGGNLSFPMTRQMVFGLNIDL